MNKLRTEEEIMKLAIETWGERSQLEMAQEESTELALACRKFIRVQNDENFKSLCSEIADVEIMIKQLKLMFPHAIEIINEQQVFKFNRLNNRLGKLQFES